MNGISNSMALQNVFDPLSSGNLPKPSQEQLELRHTFQDFVAGTFYKQMIKALRDTENKPAYFHGGPAEDMFQSLLDQQVAEDLAHEHGAAFSDPLFTVFARQLQTARSSSELPKAESEATATSSAA